jgi:hypothetical protein
MAYGPRDLELTLDEIKWRDAWIGRIDRYLKDNCFGGEFTVPAVEVSEFKDSVPCARLALAICREYTKPGKWFSAVYRDEVFYFKP